MVDRSVGLQAAFTAVARIPKPVVAAVTGYALGGGCELALCADFRVCGDSDPTGSRRSCSVSSPVPAAPSACRGSSGLRAPRTSSSPVGSSRRPKPWPLGWSIGSWLQTMSTPPRATLSLRSSTVRLRCARREGSDRPRPRGAAGQRPRDRAAAVRRSVRDEGPQHQDDLVHRERSRQGRVPRPMNPAGCRAARRDRGGVLRPEAGELGGQRHLARHGRCGPAEWAALVFSIDGLVADAVRPTASSQGVPGGGVRNRLQEYKASGGVPTRRRRCRTQDGCGGT